MEQDTINTEIYNLLGNYVADKYLSKNIEITQENMETAIDWFLNKFYEK